MRWLSYFLFFCTQLTVFTQAKVIIKPWTHASKAITGNFANNVEDIISGVNSGGGGDTLQTSLNNGKGGVVGPAPADVFDSHILTRSNGFVHSVIQAYAQHHHLVLRPDDIWFSILTQFSAYVNAHSEELRDHFVAHEGKKELCIDHAGANRRSVDYNLFAKDMGNLIQQNIRDTDLQTWIMPNFTTTTENDKIVASILMMGSLQKYFKYGFGVICGIPSVTLLGEKSDYERNFMSLDKFTEFGNDTTKFASLLKPVVQRFAATFDNPTSSEIIQFWRQILSVDDSSLYDRYGGDGAHDRERARFSDVKETMLIELDGVVKEVYIHQDKPMLLELDGVRYHGVEHSNIPPGWTKVPVTIYDHGERVSAELTAGSIGILCGNSAVESVDGGRVLDSMQPLTGWWIREKEDPRAEEDVEPINIHDVDLNLDEDYADPRQAHIEL